MPLAGEAPMTLDSALEADGNGDGLDGIAADTTTEDGLAPSM